MLICFHINILLPYQYISSVLIYYFQINILLPYSYIISYRSPLIGYEHCIHLSEQVGGLGVDKFTQLPHIFFTVEFDLYITASA